MAIISMEVLPTDARALIDRLFQEADEFERELFPQVYEGLTVQESDAGDAFEDAAE